MKINNLDVKCYLYVDDDQLVATADSCVCTLLDTAPVENGLTDSHSGIFALEFINLQFIEQNTFFKNRYYWCTLNYGDFTLFSCEDLTVDQDLSCNSNCTILFKGRIFSHFSGFLIYCWLNNKQVFHWSNYPSKEIQYNWITACIRYQYFIREQISLPEILKVEIDANCFNTDCEFWLHMGEAFLGERGYIGRDWYGVEECLCELSNFGVKEIHLHVKDLALFKHKLLLIVKELIEERNEYNRQELEILKIMADGMDLVEYLIEIGDSIENYDEIIFNEEIHSKTSYDCWLNLVNDRRFNIQYSYD